MRKYQSQIKFTGESNLTSQVIGLPQEISTETATAVKPRILMVGMHLTKTRGGISTLISEILNSSLKNEFEFVYIASQAEEFGKFSKLFLAVRAVFEFIFDCLRTRSALVYVHLGSNASLYRESIFIFLAKIFGRKVIAHFHAGDIDNYYPFQNKLGQKFIRQAINSSDQIIAVSTESARQLKNITDSPNIAVVPNAINTSSFNVVNISDAANAKNRQTDETIRLLFVGAVGKLKGERDLIQALAILRASQPNIKVSLLGYDAESLKDLCEELKVNEFIEFLGAVPMNERIVFFQKADIFVLPTYAEAMPMSVIEAMAAGLAVISTRVGGIPELVEDGVDGLLFEPGDIAALAEKISLLVNDKNLRLKMGEKARQKAREQMDFRQYTEKLRVHLLAECE